MSCKGEQQQYQHIGAQDRSQVMGNGQVRWKGHVTKREKKIIVQSQEHNRVPNRDTVLRPQKFLASSEHTIFTNQIQLSFLGGLSQCVHAQVVHHTSHMQVTHIVIQSHNLDEIEGPSRIWTWLAFSDPNNVFTCMKTFPNSTIFCMK